jgi:hypothetical protein
VACLLCGNPRSIRVNFLACVNTVELERPTEAESECSAGMRIRAADEGDVRREHINPPERIGELTSANQSSTCGKYILNTSPLGSKTQRSLCFNSPTSKAWNVWQHIEGTNTINANTKIHN